MIISDRAWEIKNTIKNKKINEIEKLHLVSSLQNPSDKQLSDSEFKSLWILYHNISIAEKIILLKDFHTEYTNFEKKSENDKEIKKTIVLLQNFSPLNIFAKNKLKNKHSMSYSIENESTSHFFIRQDKSSLSLLELATLTGNIQSVIFLTDDKNFSHSQSNLNSAFYYAILRGDENIVNYLYVKNEYNLKHQDTINFSEAYLFSDNNNTFLYDKEKYGENSLKIIDMDSFFYSELLKRDFSLTLKRIANIINDQDELFLHEIENNYIIKLIDKSKSTSSEIRQKIYSDITLFYKNIQKEIPSKILQKTRNSSCCVYDKEKLKLKMLQTGDKNFKNTVKVI